MTADRLLMYYIEYSTEKYPPVQKESAPYTLLEKLSELEFELYAHNPDSKTIAGTMPLQNEDLAKEIEGMKIIKKKEIPGD